MAKLSKTFRAEVIFHEEVVAFTLRTPTNEEVNEYQGSQTAVLGMEHLDEMGRDALMRSNRYEFFDSLLDKVENLEDEDGEAIGVDRKVMIPARWKNHLILDEFDITRIKVKN